MAIIIKCKPCGKRVIPENGQCPGCGKSDYEFTLDYMADGRFSKRIRLHLPDKITSLEEAASIEKILREKNKRKIKVIPPTDATADDLFPEYLQWYKLHRAISTHRDLSLIYRAQYSQIMGKEKVCLLTTENFDYYQKVRRTTAVTNRTINKELNYFSGFLKWCRVHKKIEIPPIQYEKLPYKRPRPEILSMDEVLRIIDAANPFYKAFILCLYLLGLRFSEARWLTGNHFDFEAKSVKVIQKGGGEKVLPVDDMLIAAIKDLNVTDPDEYIFLNPQTGRPVGRITRALENICKTAGVDKHVHPHQFRHSWATHMLGAGIDLRIIQRYLGHSQISTTEIYTHVMLMNLRSASDIVISQVNKAASTKYIDI